MFRRQNKQKDQNIRNPLNILNEEQAGGGIGNEALAQNVADGLIDLISNEANNEALGKEIPEEIAGDGLGHYYDNAMDNDKFIPINSVNQVQLEKKEENYGNINQEINSEINREENKNTNDNDWEEH